MDISHKKTALDDNASIYQKREESTKTKKLSQIPKGERLQYFMDYYLKILLAVAAGIAMLVYFLYTVLIPHQKIVLSIAAFSDHVFLETDGLVSYLDDFFDTEGIETCLVQNLDQNSAETAMVFPAMVAAKELDLLICTRDQLKQLAAADYLAPLDEIIPKEELDQIRETQPDLFLTESFPVRTEDGQEASDDVFPAVCGILLLENPVLKDYLLAGEDPVLCVITNTPRPENCLAFIHRLLEHRTKSIRQKS